MEIIFASVILSISIIYYAKSKSSYHLKPKKALAQLTIIGPTERGEETFQLTGTLWDDESEEQRNAKVDALCAIRERRVAFCNKRMMEITGNTEELLEEAKSVVKKAGMSIVEGNA